MGTSQGPRNFKRTDAFLEGEGGGFGDLAWGLDGGKPAGRRGECIEKSCLPREREKK